MRSMMLVWEPFRQGNRTPTTTCFFSDGVAQYWSGWWSNDAQNIQLKDGRIIEGAQLATIKWWAHPGNFIAETEGLK